MSSIDLIITTSTSDSECESVSVTLKLKLAREGGKGHVKTREDDETSNTASMHEREREVRRQQRGAVKGPNTCSGKPDSGSDWIRSICGASKCQFAVARLHTVLVAARLHTLCVNTSIGARCGFAQQAN